LVKNNNVKNNKSILIDNLVKNSFAGLILFSSGSTGKPKAMLHNLTNLLNSYLDRKQRKNIFLVFLMFDHIGGINTLLNCLSIGSVIVIPDSRKPTEIAEIIEKYKIEVLPASPTFLNLLLISKSTDQYDFSSLKIITYGTESMPEKLLTDLKNIFPKVRLMQTFGTSETGIIKTHSKSSTSLLLKFDDPNQEFKIINGELFIRSKTQILGYLNYQSESFTSDGWFKTGDLVEMDKDGFVKITGRINDIINVGGEKVFPIEIENIILELPYVSDCLVYGEKNAITGYSVCVDIKLNKEFSIKNEKLLIRNHCKSSLDKYKIPTKINIVMDILFNERFKKIRIK
jgi:acyl-CoA synthetase (AMP-forming)/AMP-acid ligase II